MGGDGRLWLACSNGLAVVDDTGGVTWRIVGVGAVTAVAAGGGGAAGATVVATTPSKMYILSAATGDVERWEWITRVSDSAGGPIDDVVNGMALDSCGALWLVTGAFAFVAVCGVGM